LVVTGAVVQIIAQLSNNPVQAGVIGAVAVSLIAARASLPSTPFDRTARNALTRGLLLGAAPALIALVAGLILGGNVTVSSIGGAALFGVVEALTVAYRDELWLVGLPLLFARRARVAEPVAFGYAVVASLAAAALLPGVTLTGLALRGTATALFAALWLRHRTVWAPVAAHFSWYWLANAALAGDLVDVAFSSGNIAALGANGSPAWVALATFVVITAYIIRKCPDERPIEQAE